MIFMVMTFIVMIFTMLKNLITRVRTCGCCQPDS